MPKQSERMDRLFQALAHSTRRSILERLRRGPARMSQLAQPFSMALPSFSQHLDVLEHCGLVRSRKRGRVRTYRLTPQPLNSAEHWLQRQRTQWEHRLDQLDDYLQNRKEQQ